MGVSGGASLEELEAVYESNLSSFVRTATAICGSREAGRDAVHDAFVSLVRTRERFRGTGTVEAWAWAAVVRTAQKQVARRRELPAVQPEREAGTAAAPDELSEVREVVAMLPERQRLALFLRYYGDLDYAAIADVLEVKRGTVSATLHAAHEALRTALSQPTEERDVSAI